MSDPDDIARHVAEALSKNQDQKTLEIDTSGMQSSQVWSLIDAIYTKCEEVGVSVKGIKVDPMQVPLPKNADYLNAFTDRGRLIVVDIEVDDKVIVRRK